MKLGNFLPEDKPCQIGKPAKAKKVYVQIECKLEVGSNRFGEGFIVVGLGIVISGVFMAAMYKMQDLQDD
jgi:hypothetical protein